MRRNMRFDRFEIVVEQEPDDEGYAAHSPTLPGSASSGKTFEKATRNIREAIQQHLEALPAHGHRILQYERLGHVEEQTTGVPWCRGCRRSPPASWFASSRLTSHVFVENRQSGTPLTL